MKVELGTKTTSAINNVINDSESLVVYKKKVQLNKKIFIL